jgi:glycosyltransferase involved in cell wall biosynthesis
MRILIVAHGYPPTFTGGAELRSERTARGLVNAGHDVAVLSAESFPGAESGPARREHMQDGVLVHHMQLRYNAEGDVHRQEYHHPDVATELEIMLQSWRPDVIHLFSGYLTGLSIIHTAVAQRVPVLVSLTDYWWLCHRIIMVRTDGLRCDGPSPGGCARCHWEIYRRFRIPAQVVRPVVDLFWDMATHSSQLSTSLGIDKQAERQRELSAALAMADILIAPSRVLAQQYAYHGIRTDHMRVLRQGVDLNACPVRVPSEVVRFAYFGQIKRHKGVHTLIEAWGMLAGERPHSLVLRGSERGEEEYARSLHVLSGAMANVTWAPTVSHEQIWGALAEVDVLVVPSRWLENSPNIILEAQAMGVVVIGSDLGGVSELVHHGQNGLLFDPDDSASLALQMQRIIDEPELLETLRSKPLPFGSFAAEIEQIEALYKECIQNAAMRALVAPAAGTPQESLSALIEFTEFTDIPGYSDYTEQPGATGVVE